ncbi:MAG: DUF2125 domain-containing protein [Gemmobacter sp.]
MTRISALGLAALCFGAAPAFAITPEELWAAWQAQSAAQGQTITAEATSRSGDTLALRGVSIAISPEDADLTVESDIGTVQMRDIGGGAVEVTFADSYPIRIKGSNPDTGSMGSATLRVSQPGMTIRASGTPTAISYAVAAPTLTITLEDFEAEDESVSAEATMTFTGIAAAYTTTGADMATIDGTFSVDAIAFDVAAQSPDNDGAVAMSGTSEALAGRVSGTMVPQLGTDAELPDMLRAGFAVNGGYTLGATRFNFDFAEGGEQTRAAGALTSAMFDIELDAARIAYRTGTKGLDVTVSGGDLPFPELRVTLGELGIGFMLPLARTAEPTDFSVLARMVDLVVPDDVWALGDPTGLLKRGPLTVILDAVGKARVTTDLLDPGAMDGAPPGELHALTLGELQVKGAGADLTGKGGFTFDNSDLASFDGLPRPTGAIDLQLVGGNALLDALVAMGMIPDDQVMAARMMLGLFARPGAGPDTLVSRIEVTPEGAVLANGQRIR